MVQNSSSPRADDPAAGKGKVPVWTWRRAVRKAKVAPHTKHICSCIADYISDVGKGAYPSVKTLIEDSGLSNRSVATHLAAAEAAGLLHIEREVGADGRFKRSTYFPRFPDEAVPRRQASTISTPENDEPDPQNDPSNLDDRVKDAHAARPSEGASRGPPGDRVNLVHEPREPGAENRVKEVHAELSIEEQSTEPPTHTTARDAHATRACGQVGKLLKQRREQDPNQRDAIDGFIAPLLATKPLQRSVLDPSAFVEELIDGIAARNFDIAILKRGLALAREERTTMPSLARCLQLFDRVVLDRARAERTTPTAGRATTAAPTDVRTASFHEQLRAQIGETRFQAWQCHKLHVVSVKDGGLTYSVPHDGLRRMVAKEFAADLLTVAQATFGSEIGRIASIVHPAPAAVASESPERHQSASAGVKPEVEVVALQQWCKGIGTWDRRIGHEPESEAEALARIAALEAKVSETFRTSPPSTPGPSPSTKHGVAPCA